MGTREKAAIMLAVGLMIPCLTQAKGINDSMHGLHGVLDQLYDEMMPLCAQLIGIGQGIAGFGATWYIAARVWRHIANAEPIDFYPLFRPFVLGFCIMIFPSVLALINGVMKPAVTGTAAMVQGSNSAITVLNQQRENALVKSEAWKMYVGKDGYGGDYDRWYKYTHDNEDSSQDSALEGLGNAAKFGLSYASFGFSNLIKMVMSTVLNFIFELASLCIDTMRTFHLVVLAILGPFAFGLAVFDGFQYTLTAWLARYINIYLWLPVANIFGALIGKIQQMMLTLDVSQLQDKGDTFFNSNDLAYMVFLAIGIVGYFTVPSVANSIVNIGGGGALSQKVNHMAGSTVQGVTSGISGASSNVGGTNQSRISGES